MARKRAQTEETKNIEEEQNNTEEPKVKQTADKTYTVAEVQAIIAELTKNKKNEKETPDLKDDRKKVRLTRIEGKMVVDFVNQNNDPFLPNLVTHAYNQWNEKIKQNEAYIEVKFDDGSTKHMPLLYLVSNGRPIVCPIVREKNEDTSFVEKSAGNGGMVERRIYEEKDRQSGMTGTGILVEQTVKQKKVSFIVSTPDGKEIEVPEYVVNIV